MTAITEPLTICDEQAVYYEEWVSQSLADLAAAQQEAQEQVRGLFGPDTIVDEMAVMFRDPDQLRSWVEAAVRVPSITLFNTAHDSVTTQPIPSRYNVHYWFLSVPPQYGNWRIEAMYAHAGSPLHDALRRQAPSGVALTVHASFKCADEEAYGTATNTLMRHGYDVVQKCESTYGRFSYWRPEVGDSYVLLKPRVNLRDREDNASD